MTTTHTTHRSPNPKELDRLIPSRALPALLDFWTLCDFIGMRKDRSSRLFFWRGAKNGTFPAPVKLSEARIAWRRDEAERWLVNRPRAIYSKAKDADSVAEVTPASEPAPITRARVTITQTPKGCPECGSGVTAVGGRAFVCADAHGVGCDFSCLVTPEDGTDAA